MRGQVFHAAVGQHLEGLFDHRHIVFRQVARVGTRISQGLVALVEALGQGQGGFGREAKAGIGFALQAGQVKQARAGLGGWLALFGDAAGSTAHGIGDGDGVFQAPDPVGFEFAVV